MTTTRSNPPTTAEPGTGRTVTIRRTLTISPDGAVSVEDDVVTTAEPAE